MAKKIEIYKICTPIDVRRLNYGAQNNINAMQYRPIQALFG